MLPHTSLAEKNQDTEFDRRIKPLRWLADEINAMSAVATLMPDQFTPYVHVSVPSTCGFRVTVTMRDGEHLYEWGDWDFTHRLSDPAGCARRIVTWLRKERADNEAERHREVTQ